MTTITSGDWMGHLGRGLAPRELQCVLFVAQGLTAKEIAKNIDIAPGTVDKRLSAAMFKLGVLRRTALVAEAMKRQIISPACYMLAAMIAMHTVMGDDPARRERRSGDRRVAHLRVERTAEAFEHYA